MKLGLYGGTFDPVHYGHLLLAEWTREELSLDKIIFIPAYIPPHKRGREITCAELRLEMVNLATKDNPHFEVSTLEIEKENISYSIETIRYFKDRYKLSKSQLFFIIGADSLFDFSEWYMPNEILKNCVVVVHNRTGFHIDKDTPFIDKVKHIDNPLIEYSSSQIRERIFSNRSIMYMVPPQVEKFIYDNSLYRKKY